MIARGALAALAAVVAVLALAAPAWGDADITDADVALRLAPNGDLLVTERLNFNYDGTFEGSYRDIDLLHGERIGDVSVSQDGQPFRPGGNTALGSHDRAGRLRGHVELGNTESGSSGTTRPPTSSGPRCSPTASATRSSPTTTCSTSAGRSGARSGTSTSTT